MLITNKRHPFDMHIKLGADGSGKLTALALDAIVDNGAYHSIGNVVINRGLHMLSSFLLYSQYQGDGETGLYQ